MVFPEGKETTKAVNWRGWSSGFRWNYPLFFPGWVGVGVVLFRTCLMGKETALHSLRTCLRSSLTFGHLDASRGLEGFLNLNSSQPPGWLLGLYSLGSLKKLH